MMLQSNKSEFVVPPEAASIVRELGLTPDGVFTRPDIVAWRKLPDRENCTLDAVVAGEPIRLHVKRYPAARGWTTPADDDVHGLMVLTAWEIPTAALIAHGRLADGRSFVITRDLAGYTPADKLIESGTPFDVLLLPTADLAAKLHHGGLHHRDLYLCHFMARLDQGPPELALIDTARVRRLGGIFFRGRWIVKDLAQFWYSTTKLPISDAQRDAWLKRYAEQRGLPGPAGLKTAVLRKVKWITRHDRSLNGKQPGRNVSIPD